MSSERRIRASRANGKLSRGPVTPEGKKRSSYNALRHGMLANITVLECEDRATFDLVLRQYVNRLLPADEVEMGFIEEMVNAFWRIRRSWAAETRAFENLMAAQPEGDNLDRISGSIAATTGGPNPLLIQRYEARLHRMYQRALKNLMLLREIPLPNEPNPNYEHGLPVPDGPRAPEPFTLPPSVPDSPEPSDDRHEPNEDPRTASAPAAAVAQTPAAPSPETHPFPAAAAAIRPQHAATFTGIPRREPQPARSPGRPELHRAVAAKN